MAKFDKDVFLSDITDKVKGAIESGLISQEDINNDDTDRLVGFIQYALSDYIEDRKGAIDILRDFNYDERYAWSALEKQIGGEIKSLFDVALANLWKFLESSGLLSYAYYTEGVSAESSKASPIVSYEDEEFEDENDLAGEINDDEFEEDFEDDFIEEEPMEDEEEVEESYAGNFDDDFDFDEMPTKKEWWEEDEEEIETPRQRDYKYDELIRRRNASSRRNFRSR